MKYLKLFEEYDKNKKMLDISGKDLDIFPPEELPLPFGIETLNCSMNKLKELPELPDTLKELNCYKNELVTLPKLPERLKHLFCSDNKLKELPEIPQSVVKLAVNGNDLSELPELPRGLKVLYCHQNHLSSLPRIPDSVVEIGCDRLYPQIPARLLNNALLTEMPKNEDEINKYVEYRIEEDEKEYDLLPREYKTKYIQEKYPMLATMDLFDLFGDDNDDE